MADKTNKLEQELEDFRLAHYLNADFDSLIEKTVQLYRRFEKLKDKKKQNRVVLDLYTLYLQATEILFINSHALSTSIDRFPSSLFINSVNLREFIDDNFTKTTQLSSWFFSKLIFSVIKDNKKTNEKHNLYENLIKEVSNDYLDNFNLLNAYKHGYRVKAKHDKTTLSLSVGNGQHFKLNESDSTITYFSKENRDGVPIILEHSLNFKIGRVFGKCLFVCSLLNNMRITMLLHYKNPVGKKDISSFYINDREEWSSTFGGSHIKKPVFSLKKPSKSNAVPK